MFTYSCFLHELALFMTRYNKALDYCPIRVCFLIGVCGPTLATFYKERFLFSVQDFFGISYVINVYYIPYDTS